MTTFSEALAFGKVSAAEALNIFDNLDTVELLRAFEGNPTVGEHGPHAVIAHPDGKRITVVCGNQTKLQKFDSTRVPPIWGEDHLLPRLPDGNGFMAGVMGPGGAIYISLGGNDFFLLNGCQLRIHRQGKDFRRRLFGMRELPLR